MLTIRRKRGSVAALAVLLLAALMALTGGTAMVPVQAQTLESGATTLTPGQGASPQEELLAEALGAIVKSGFDPQKLDLGGAVYHPSGQAVFVPLTDIRIETLPAFIGWFYARIPVVLKGKQVPAGLHPVYILHISVDLSASIMQAPPSPRVPPGWIHCEKQVTFTVGPVSWTDTYYNRECFNFNNNPDPPNSPPNNDPDDDDPDDDDVINESATVACLIDPTLPYCK